MTSIPRPVESPLRNTLFLAMWSAGLATSIAQWMQSVGAAWMMTGLTPSPLMVALVQTATSLPAFLFGLPGGVLADLIDRRGLLLATLVWMALSILALCVLTYFGGVTPWVLLLLTFSIGAGSALQLPAWQSAPSEVLPRDQLPAALALQSMSGNGARAAGPALAGILIAWLGSGSVFIAALVCLLVSLVVVARWRMPSRRASSLPPESLLGGMQSGMRYVRHSPVLRGQIIRVFISIFCAGALFALLPVIARHQLGLGAAGYGLLLAFLGGGAVLGAFSISQLQHRYDPNSIVAVAFVTYAASMICIAYAGIMALDCAALVVAGVAWVLMGSLPNAAVQTALPGWVRARAVALFLLAFQASMAIGAVVWGSLATHIGTAHSLAVSAALLVLSLLYARHHPVRMGSEAQVTYSTHWAEPVLAVEPDPEDGPVAVQVEYHIDPAQRAAFVEAVYLISTTRKRDGATIWRLYRDLSEPSHFVERFVVDSWAEYLRQRARATVADRLAEEHLHRFHIGAAPPEMLHFIMEPRP